MPRRTLEGRKGGQKADETQASYVCSVSAGLVVLMDGQIEYPAVFRLTLRIRSPSLWPFYPPSLH